MIRSLLRVRIVTIAGAILTLCCGCAPSPAASQTEGEARSVTVEHVLDGDTIIVDGDERVRLLGVDAPEVSHNGSIAEPCANEAATLSTTTLESAKTVELVTDDSQPATDRFGRTLAYVEADGADMSAKLLETGLADVYYAAPTISRFSDYRKIAATAPAPKCHG